jgi:hypothetical protein
MNRRVFLATTAKAGLAGVTLGGMGLGLTGCGGGGNNNGRGDTVTTQTGGNGLIRDVEVLSGGASVFISRAQAFELNWPDGNPPAEFTVSLRRFQEERGGESLSNGTQRITLTQLDGSSWSLRRRDNFDLDAGGVYYIELLAPGQPTQRFVYIVSNDRSRAVTVNPNTGGFLEDIIISPRSGFAFVGISDIFTLSWTGAFPPPNTFTAQLRRYKEERGNDSGSDTEQDITLTQQGTNFVWNLVRRNNSVFERNATYYIEITSGGNLIRAPFITANF